MVGNVLSGNTRVRTPNGLVRLDELSGSGPAGPPGEQGPPGIIDVTNYYNKPQVDFKTATNKVSSAFTDGVEVYNASDNTIRRILGLGGIVAHIFMNHQDPEDSRNGAVVVNGDGVGGSIDPKCGYV